MAKLKIKQIEDLGIVAVSGTGVVAHNEIQIGAKAITPLTSITDDTQTSGYISGLTVSGNNIVIARTALTIPGLTIEGNNLGTFVLGAAVDGTDNHKINLTKGTFGESLSLDTDNKLSVSDTWVKSLFSVNPANPTEGTKYISGLAYTGGVFAPTYTDLTAAGVPVAPGIEKLEATNVQAALAELAGDIATLDAAQLTPGSGIAISNDHEISTTVTLNYDSTTNTIQLLNKANGDVIGTVDAKAFLKDGMVSSATVVTNPEGQPEGTYIKLTFNTQDPVSTELSHEDIFINVTSLIDIYTAGNDGIEVDGRVISHKAGVVLADTQKGAVSGNTITVPVVKVDGYGHVIALTEATWTLPESTALESVSGSTSDYITVTVGEKDENKTQQITATATIGSFETNGANGLATTDAVKTYVDSKIANQTTEEITLTQIVRGTEFADNIELTVPDGYTILEGSTVGFLNGQLVPSVTVSGNIVTYVPYTDGDTVAYEEGDRFDVIATVTKTITVVKVEQA